ncbi:MAG TPA: hypothetical protein VM285_10280 [Polyangia bacterium]|nr:hypothetical protein [Polyangia bacterium]
MTDKNETARKAGDSWKERNGGLIFGVAIFGALALITILMWFANG